MYGDSRTCKKHYFVKFRSDTLNNIWVWVWEIYFVIPKNILCSKSSPGLDLPDSFFIVVFMFSYP